MNPRVPTYWFWFCVFWGLIGLIPFWRNPLTGGRYILVCAYARAAPFPWQQTLLLHTSLAAVLGVIATAVHHFRGMRRGVERDRVYTTFGIRTLLVASAILAVIFGYLRFMHADPIVFACVFIGALGQPLASLVVYRLERR